MIDLTYIYSNSLLHKIDPAIKFAGLILLSIVILISNKYKNCFYTNQTSVLVLCYDIFDECIIL